MIALLYFAPLLLTLGAFAYELYVLLRKRDPQ